MIVSVHAKNCICVLQLKKKHKKVVVLLNGTQYAVLRYGRTQYASSKCSSTQWGVLTSIAFDALTTVHIIYLKKRAYSDHNYMSIYLKTHSISSTDLKH